MLCRRAIQRLYGDKSEDVFAAMRQHPASAVPIVLRRLQQKHTEWRAAQRQWNRVWREANERNYLKSLDYKVPAPRVTHRRLQPSSARTRWPASPRPSSRTCASAGTRTERWAAIASRLICSIAPHPTRLGKWCHHPSWSMCSRMCVGRCCAHVQPEVFADVNRLLLYSMSRANYGADKVKMEVRLRCDAHPL